MEIFNQILDYIARTNLFNFAIFLAIIIFLVKKLDVSGILDSARESVNTAVNDSTEAKESSEEKLHSVEESFSHLEEKIDTIVKASESNAKLVGEKIISEGEKSAVIIRENSEKMVENNRVLLKNDLLKRAANASIETAKERIINELNKNGSLHDKFIEESVNTIEGMEL